MCMYFTSLSHTHGPVPHTYVFRFFSWDVDPPGIFLRHAVLVLSLRVKGFSLASFRSGHACLSVNPRNTCFVRGGVGAALGFALEGAKNQA